MPVVQNTVLDPSGAPVVAASVYITLATGSNSTPGYLPSSDVIKSWSTTTDSTGKWSVTLAANSTLTPANTYYQVAEAGYISNVVVPAGGGPYNLSQILATPPAALGVQAATLDAAGQVSPSQLLRVDGRRFSVRDPAYGAVGDGVTDDTAAIAAAWAAVKAAGSGVLWFPRGTYLTTGVVLQGGSNFGVVGERGAVIWTSRGTVAAPTQATHNVLTIADCTDFSVAGIEVDGRRDIIAADQFITVNAASGQKNVTVQDGTKYVVGEMVTINGGLTANGGTEKTFQDPFQYITAINGNVLTMTSNLTHSYTATGAQGGAWVTRYQTGDSTKYTVAGRALGNEDAQNGIHLISCQRFQVTDCTAHNVWESPIKMGTGFATTTVTDGCFDGIVKGCLCTHGYDQGVSVWMSERIAVVGNVCRDAGWGGVVFTHSRDCSATGNVCTNNVYSPPSDLNEGSGIAVEGGERITVSGNICTGNNSNGIRITNSPVFLGNTTTSGSVAAAATSFTVGSTSFMKTGTSHTIIDPNDATIRENFQVQSIAGNVVTVTAPLRYGYASGASITARYCSDVAITGNTCSNTTWSSCINVQQAIGLRISGNDCSYAGMGVDTFGTYGIQVSNAAHGTVVSDNTCGRNAQEGILVDTCIGVQVLDNLVFGSGLSSTQKHGIRFYNAQDSVIAGNRCERNSQDGIHLEPGGQRTTIADNNCRYNAGRGIIIYGQPSWGMTVIGNRCSFNVQPGIEFQGVRDSLLQGNDCSNNQQQGIRLNDNGANFCTKNLILSNVLYDDQGAHTQSWGIQELGSTANSTVAYNRAYGNTNAGQLSLSGTSTSTGNLLN